MNLLKAVGALQQGKQIWVLFETPTGKVYSAKTGTRIGNQNGIITKINESGAVVVQNHQTIYLKFNKDKAC